MKKLTTPQKQKLKSIKKENRMDVMELYVTDKAKEIFKRPPYGGKKG